ncbi:MAG TPA: DUF6010 family protein [Saprospiraceae bacterium]|nr:DUF6010 family protein [Saprospiraceae bacterium]
MNAAIIGISSGLLIIVLIAILKQLDKKLIYGLQLSAIGFLYVGFVWTDMNTLIINSIQAVLFQLIAYYGIKRNIYILAAGYFLHGCWDIGYNLIATPGLIPPHYEWFCLSIDFTIGIYILFISKQFLVSKNPLAKSSIC